MKTEKQIKHLAWRTANPEKRLFGGAKGRALKKGIPFLITLDDIVIPTHCPYLGFALTNSPSDRLGTNPSLDRKIPDLGYIPGNVQVISDLANRMKANATEEQLLTFAQSVIKMKELSEVRDSN